MLHVSFIPLHLTWTVGRHGGLQGVFFYWSPLKCLSMELVLAPQFQTGPPNTECDQVC